MHDGRLPRAGRVRRKLLVGLVVFTVVAVVAWIFAVPAIVRSRLATMTGCPVEAETISINPFAASVRLEDFHLRNPAGFAIPEFVDLTRFEFDADLFSLGSDVVQIPRAVLELAKVTIVTGKDGVTNTAVVRRNIETALGPSPAETEPAAEQKFHIGELIVRIGSVDLVDYSRGGPEPVRRTVAIQADHRFTDVTDPKVVIRPLVADLARANAGEILGSLGGLMPAPFRDALGGFGEVLEDPARAGETVKKLIDLLPSRR